MDQYVWEDTSSPQPHLIPGGTDRTPRRDLCPDSKLTLSDDTPLRRGQQISTEETCMDPVVSEDPRVEEGLTPLPVVTLETTG